MSIIRRGVRPHLVTIRSSKAKYADTSSAASDTAANSRPTKTMGAFSAANSYVNAIREPRTVGSGAVCLESIHATNRAGNPRSVGYLTSVSTTNESQRAWSAL